MLSLPLFAMGLLLVCMTLLAKVRLHDWWLRACEFPRVQIATLALAVLVLSMWSEAPWQTPTALCGLLVLVTQLYRILPWTRLWKVQVLDAEEVDEEFDAVTARAVAALRKLVPWVAPLIAPGGRLPVNTNGGGLSYMHSGMYGMYALQESVRQMRGIAPA